MTLAACLPPVVAPDARLLILGSLPGRASLDAARYYAHPQNAFWPLIGAVLDDDLTALPYEQRLETLRRRRVALWDTVGTARRHGSLDSALREVDANDLPGFVATLPELRAIGFNGKAASRIGRAALGPSALALIDLPSSSPAYTRPPADKRRAWLAVRAFLS